jgi:hypothetical protein
MSTDRHRVPAIDELRTLVEERVGDPSPVVRLREALRVGRELTDLSDELIGRFVAEARANGLSWTEIGHVFGTSKQAAQQRYGSVGDAVGRWAERWTPAANDVLDRAGEQARELGHNYVGTEHVLLVLATPEHGRATAVLGELGITPQHLLATSCMRPGPGASPQECLAVMPRLKQALEHGRRIADDLGARLADTEHLLAGIVAVSDSMAVEMLRRRGVSADDVRTALARHLDVEPERLGAPRRRRRRLRAIV